MPRTIPTTPLLPTNRIDKLHPRHPTLPRNQPLILKRLPDLRLHAPPARQLMIPIRPHHPNRPVIRLDQLEPPPRRHRSRVGQDQAEHLEAVEPRDVLHRVLGQFGPHGQVPHLGHVRGAHVLQEEHDPQGHRLAREAQRVAAEIKVEAPRGGGRRGPVGPEGQLVVPQGHFAGFVADVEEHRGRVVGFESRSGVVGALDEVDGHSAGGG